MVKRKKQKGGADTLTKQEVLQDPKIKEAFKSYVAQQGGGSMYMRRMKGMGWWDDFVSWLRDNKVISTASKIGSAIAGAVGFLPLSTALGAVGSASSALGYGRKRMIMKGMGNGATPIAYNNVASSNSVLKF
jgi:hypothetical protein